MRSIVSLASELDLMVIAEGVETEEELERLQQLNCQYAQGFCLRRGDGGPGDDKASAPRQFGTLDVAAKAAALPRSPQASPISLDNATRETPIEARAAS